MGAGIKKVWKDFELVIQALTHLEQDESQQKLLSAAALPSLNTPAEPNAKAIQSCV